MNSRSEKWTILLQLAKYGVVGISMNLLAYLLYLACTQTGIGHKTAMSLIYVVATIISFTFNKRWTFTHEGENLSSFLRYAATYASGYVTNLLLMILLVDHLGYPHQIVQLILILVVAVQLFLIQKLWVFRAVTEGASVRPQT